MALKDVIIGYAKGDKGDKGDTGERGATGQTGPQGEPGNIADAAITDTQGLDVAKGAKTTAQKLFDAIADRIVNKLVTNDALTTKLADYLLKSAMSSTNIDSTTNVPTSALVYSLMQDVNNNLSNNLYKAVYTDDIFITTERPTFVYWNGTTKNTPFKSGLTSCTEGFAFSYGAWAGYMTVVCFVKNDSTMWIWSKSRNAWVEYAAKSDLEPVKSRQINTYTSAEKNTDTVLSSYENKDENFILLFSSNDTTGTIPTLTGSHLFVIEHLLVGDDSASAIERAYSTKGKLIAWRFKQWWDKTWTAWENS